MDTPATAPSELDDYERIARGAIAAGGVSVRNDLTTANTDGSYVVGIRIGPHGKPLGERHAIDTPKRLAPLLLEYHNRPDVQEVLTEDPSSVLGLYVEAGDLFFDVSRMFYNKHEAILNGKLPDSQGNHENSIYVANAPAGQNLVWLEYYDDRGSLYDASVDDHIPPSDNDDWKNSPYNPRHEQFEPSAVKASWHPSDVWTAAVEPTYEIGQKVRKKVIGNGFIHGVVVDAEPHPEHKQAVYTVAWENGPVERSQEWPHQLMKEDDFTFAPHDWRPTAAGPATLDEQWHTVPQYDHRDTAKYKPGDTVQTTIGLATIINSAKTPLGQLYRVETLSARTIHDLLENDIVGKSDSKMYYAGLPTHFPDTNGSVIGERHTGGSQQVGRGGRV